MLASILYLVLRRLLSLVAPNRRSDHVAQIEILLAFPIAFKGRLVQYVGRVLRPIDGKSRVEVHDYVDVRVPVLARMHAKRLAAYASLGFDVRRNGDRPAVTEPGTATRGGHSG